MGNIKQYESFRTEQEIKDLCSEYEIENYQIRDDGSIDADYVDLYERLGDLKQLPITFNEVKGDFDCRVNNLTTLEGCPKIVHGIFACTRNRLTSLEHSPEKILEGSFYCYDNHSITTLEGLENTYIDEVLDVRACRNLYSIKGFPKKVGNFICYYTPIYPIYDTFIQECDYDTMRKFNKFDVIYTDGLDWFIDYDNLGKFLRSVGKDEISMEDFDDFIKTTKYKWEY
jgi:hypothetical protein